MKSILSTVSRPLVAKITSHLALVAMASTPMLVAATEAYEPFDYPVGVLTGQNGGTGFSGGWVATRGANMQGAVWNEATNVAFGTETPALIWNGVLNNNFPTYPATGARYVGATTTWSSDLHIARTLASSAGAMAGADGVLWLSAVYHVANANSGAGINIGLGNGYVHDRGRYFSIAANGAASSTVSFIGANGYTGSAWNTRLNPIVTAGSWTPGQYARTNGATALVTTADMIVVLKFAFGASDTVEAAYFTENETLDEAAFNSRKVGATYVAGIDENALTVLSVSQGRMANAIDEIRIGNSFVDVISPPSNFEYQQWAAQYPGVGLPGDDADGDGLTNETERTLATHPLVADTDGDSYSDGAEVTAGSNPLVAASKPGDIDADSLPDTWETANFGNLSHDGTADSDDDLLIDSLEFTMGLNPNDSDTDDDGHPDWMGIPGYLYVEQWNNIPGAALQDLLDSTAFHGPASDVYLVTLAKALGNTGDNYGLKMTGRVIAPVTGSYRFWIAGDGPSRLYLSTDSTAYKRRQVATVKVASGEEQWDLDATQKSAAIDLVAGQEYYIEALMKESTGADHLALAWEYPGQARQIIPAAQLRSYVVDAGDADADGMLDTWESSVGLDTSDSGGTDPSQSAYADTDGDGLLNFEEYNYNGNPQVAGGNSGWLELSVWNGISGAAVKDLIGNSKYIAAPDLKAYAGADISGLGLNFGARLRGTLTAPQTGDYVFTIAGDEQAELWFSSSDSPFAKRKIAYSPTRTSYQQWTTGTRQSAGIHLKQGESYYIEALVKNATASDHLSIGWSRIAESDWQVADIGAGTSSSWSVNPATGSAQGTTTGGDINNAADNFTFRHALLQGNCEMVARIADLDSTNPGAKAGLMIRDSLAADSALALVYVTADGRIALVYRNATGVQTVGAGAMPAGQPYQWLRIARVGNFFNAYCSLDGLSWKLVATCTIPMAQTVHVGMATASGASNAQVAAVWDRVGFTDLSRVAVIPSSVLASFKPSPLDLDDDSLPDAWETANGLDASTAANGMGQYGDPDGDHVSNLDEYLLDSDPQHNGGIAGNLTREVWPALIRNSIQETVTSIEFLQGSGQIEMLPASEQLTLGNTAAAQRVRGTIVAPVTGDYRFWISGYSDYELWLSRSGPSKFEKRKLAGFNENDFSGGYTVDFREWDSYAAQHLEPIHLQAGQEYFIEVLHKHSKGAGHFSVAWSYTDQSSGVTTDRGLIPASQLRSHTHEPNDADDDCLPDDWESQYSLSPADNGRIDPARQGERGDYDGDGLTNHEEYLLNTNPANADTDGDGESDGNEVNALGSNALVANAINDTFLSQVSLGSYVSSSTAWTMTSGGLLADSFRGEATWDFSVPSDGHWLFRLDLELMGTLYGDEQVPIVIKVDGKTVVRRQVRFGSSKFGLLQALTPWLLAGNHQITVLVDNSLARRAVRLVSLKIYAPSNASAMLAQGNSIISHPEATRTSPAFLEGYARDPGSVTLNGIPAQAGAGNGHWYANVPLNNLPAAQTYTLQYEQGWQTTGTFTWQATNVMDGETLTIRRGDTLRVGAWGSDPAMTSTITSSTAGTVSLIGQETTTHTFPTAGTFTVSGSLQSGASAVLTVKVIPPPGFSSQIVDVLDHKERNLSVPAAPEVAFDTQDDFSRLMVSRTPTIATVGILAEQPGETGIAARLFAGGPILAVQRINVIGVSDATQNDLTSSSSSDIPGYKLLQTPLTVLNLPAGARIDASIIRAGIMFPNGTTLMSIRPEDLVNGSVVLQFLYPLGQPGGYCHTLRVFDRNGVSLGYR